MATWAEVEARVPAAVRWRASLALMPVAHLATVRRDGTPRIHPVCPHLALGQLFVAVTAASPKRFDLARPGGRYALHSINVDQPRPEFDEFEFSVTGSARRAPVGERAAWEAVRAVAGYSIPDEDWLFELEVESALSATWDPMDAPGRRAYRLMWREGWEAPRAPANEAGG
jgi:hypothetical protein